MDYFDSVVTRAINSIAGSSAALDQFMIGVSSFGIPILVLLVVSQWWRRTSRGSVRHVLIAAGLSFIVGLGLNQLVLIFVHRVRPYDNGVSHLLIQPSADWSFPSDHATASFAIASAFLLHRMPRVGLAFIAASVLMMLSRVFVGTHYIGDVLGGALTGFLGAAVVRMIYRQGTRLDEFVIGIF